MANFTTNSANSTKCPRPNSAYTSLIPGLPYDVAIECLVRVPISNQSTLRLVSRGWNSAISDPSFYAHRRRVNSAERLIFLIQQLPQPPPEPSKETHGLSPPMYNLNVFNYTLGTWQSLCLSGASVPAFAHCVAVAVLGKVVVFGGWDPLTLDPVSRVIVVDLRSGTWREGAPMPTARSFFACALVGSTTIYVAGGHDGQKNALRSAEVYDIISDEWTSLPQMSEERDESHGMSLDGKNLWVISGYGTESQGRFRSDAEVYDPTSKKWSKIEGVWPYNTTSPKFTAKIMGNKWIYLGEGLEKQFDLEDNMWKGVNFGEVPKRVNGSKSVCLVDLEENEGVFVMGNGKDCDEEVFILQEKGNMKDNKGKTKFDWKCVQAPSRFLGLPFSASQILI